MKEENNNTRSPESESKNIVIVDDMPKNIQVIGTVLQNNGYLINIAHNGPKAITLVEKMLETQKPPDLILLDILMPEMDGFETYTKIKGLPGSEEIPIIFLSAVTETKKMVEGFKLGAVDYITKPIASEELLLRIKTHLTLRELHQKIAANNKILEKTVALRTQELTQKNRILEAEIKKRKEKEFVIDSASSPIIITNIDETITYANPAFLKLWGYKEKNEITGTKFINHFTETTELENGLGELKLKGKWENEIQAVKKDGNIFDVNISLSIVYDKLKHPVGLTATFIDISQRKRVLTELAKTKQTLDNIINSMPSAIIGIDSDHRIVQWNLEAEKITNITAEYAGNKKLTDIFPDMSKYVDKIKLSINNHKIYKFEKIILDIAETRIFDLIIYPLAENEIKAVVLRIDDITKRKKLEEMIIQSEKMMSVGGLAAGMAHEINNPLSGISQSIQNFIRRSSPDFPKNIEVADACGLDFNAFQIYMEKRKLKKYLKIIQDSSDRAAKIVANMLQFSRRSESKPVDTNLPALLDKIIELASVDYDLKKKYDFRQFQIIREFEEDLAEVPCLPMEIEQVLLNLLKNAAQAIKDQKKREAEPCIRIGLYREDKWVRIEVEDNGPGMTPETCNRIFEPFYTTKPPGIGTGLGLSVSYFIITHNHDGEMFVRSTPEKGSCFTIRLPWKRRVK